MLGYTSLVHKSELSLPTLARVILYSYTRDLRVPYKADPCITCKKEKEEQDHTGWSPSSPLGPLPSEPYAELGANPDSSKPQCKLVFKEVLSKSGNYV